MSDYDDEVLADAPVRYWKGEDLSGTVATDSSGNGGDGVISGHASLTLGIPGPIETDGTSLGAAGWFADADAPSGGDADLRDNFTLEMWGRVDELSGDHGLLTRLGQFGLNGSFCVGFNSGSVFAMISGSAGAADMRTLQYNDVIVGPYYYIVVVRNDTVLTLQVNDLEVDQDATFPTGPIVRASYNSAPWVLGSLHSTFTTGHAFFSNGGARWALYPTALSYTRRLAHYEAALNVLGLAGQSSVVPTATLSSLIEPSPISFPFRHNWDQPLVERIAFRTDVSRARDGAESGNGQRATPRREFEFTQVLRNHTERRKLRALLWANQHSKWLVPVRQDAEQLSAAVSAGATVVPVTTTYKDYQPGGYIGLRQLDGQGNITHWEEQVIATVGPSSITCDPLTYDYAANSSLVYPVRRALLDSAVNITGHTDSVEELTLTARLLAEDEPVTPNRITPWTPSLKYRDHEVFDPALWQSNDWSETREYDVERDGETIDFDTGPFAFDSDTIGASETTSYRVVLKGRAAIASILGWFYERAGQLRYLWVPTMQEDFEVLDADGDDLLVADTNYSDSFALAEPRRDLAFVYHDNTMEFRRVVGFAGVTNETLTLDSPVPTLANLRSVSLLKFSRLDGDQIEIAWHTDDAAVITWRFREPLHSPEGTGVSSLSPSASQSHSLSPSGSPSPSSSESSSRSPSASISPSGSISPSASLSPSASPSLSASPSGSSSHSPSPSASISPSSSPSPST